MLIQGKCSGTTKRTSALSQRVETHTLDVVEDAVGEACLVLSFGPDDGERRRPSSSRREQGGVTPVPGAKWRRLGGKAREQGRQGHWSLGKEAHDHGRREREVGVACGRAPADFACVTVVARCGITLQRWPSAATFSCLRFYMGRVSHLSPGSRATDAHLESPIVSHGLQIAVAGSRPMTSRTSPISIALGF